MAASRPVPGAAAERERRAERILDTARELLVSWGYRRVTVEEVARRAGVGKGTVYLHWRTKEALFLAVLARIKLALNRLVVAAVREDPAGLMPSRMARTVYLAAHDDPAARVVMLGDTETLGRLAHVAAESHADVSAMAMDTVVGLFELMREHGLLRDERTPREQFQIYLAVVTGFMLSPQLAPAVAADRAAAVADQLEHTLRSAIENPPDPAALAAVAPVFIARYEHLIERLQKTVDSQLHL
ncbi:TetR/AcrR family transcriptional regulator [Allonocardiopsis opalescens]|uniref:TetR family transcriptional regulator n=1 Tax=Allonocardiopsis opalescens TaxID=1144618 RepID=A0A2T0QFN4_9ACTN|nr:TetR/AcrR family transcriptional regulator [Allonocardiopsis opalescens]PRY02661.1 TetR family transcriptional regulator [Allonocardiopsis opalescens]